MDCSPPGSSVHGISRGEYCSGLPLPTPGDLPDPGIEPPSPTSPAWAGRVFRTEPLQERPLPWSSPKTSTLEDPERRDYPFTVTHRGQLVSRTRPRAAGGARGDSLPWPQPGVRVKAAECAIPEHAAFGDYFQLTGSKPRDVFSELPLSESASRQTFLKELGTPPRVTPTRADWPFPPKTRGQHYTQPNCQPFAPLDSS